jgi:hypothetical protein
VALIEGEIVSGSDVDENAPVTNKGTLNSFLLFMTGTMSEVK